MKSQAIRRSVNFFIGSKKKMTDADIKELEVKLEKANAIKRRIAKLKDLHELLTRGDVGVLRLPLSENCGKAGWLHSGELSYDTSGWRAIACEPGLSLAILHATQDIVQSRIDTAARELEAL